MVCKHCGAEIKAGEQICSYCDCKVEPEVQKFEQPNNNEGALPDDYFRTYYSDDNNSDSDDKINSGSVIMSLLIPIVGIVLGITSLCSGKRKAGLTYLALGGVSILSHYFSWFDDIAFYFF